MLKKIYQNARKPQGFGGKIMINRMNKGHASLSEWGFSHLSPAKDASCLDIGCGGGLNLEYLLSICPNGNAAGIDYSPLCVKTASEQNKTAIATRRCRVLQGDVSALPFNENEFDIATAFETIYFWPEIADSFKQVLRVLKPSGVFFICNESDGLDADGEKWAAKIDGMTLYNKEQLCALLKDAGFCDITADEKKENNWLCVSAKKPQA